MEDHQYNQSYHDPTGLDDFYGSHEVISPCTFNTNQHVISVVSLYIHSIICILGFVGNILVIITYALYKNTKSMTDVFLLNVAIADLLFVFALPFIVYNELHSWPMGAAACKLLRGSYSVNLYCGMLLLACISIDRYIVIIHAQRCFGINLLSYSRLICVFVWVFALLLSIPTFLFYHWYEPHSDDIIMLDTSKEEVASWDPQHICEMKFEDDETAKRVKVAVPSVQLAVGFFLPLLIMTICYTKIIASLLKAKNFHRHKAMWVVLVVVVVFITCHLPYNFVLLYDTASMFQLQSCDEADAWQTALTVTQSIAYLHCCLNPVVYGFIGARFRTALSKVFQDLRCLNRTRDKRPSYVLRTLKS